MIRLISLLARNSGRLSHAQFVQDWAEGSPALLTACDLTRRYVQYQLQPDRVWPPGPPLLDLKLDGIEEIWLDGTPDQAAEIAARVMTPGYLTHLRRFVGAMAI